MLLPEPLGPMRPTTVPGAMSNEQADDGAEAAEPLAEAGEGELRRARYFLSHANGGTGTYLPPAAAATDSG